MFTWSLTTTNSGYKPFSPPNDYKFRLSDGFSIDYKFRLWRVAGIFLGFANAYILKITWPCQLVTSIDYKFRLLHGM
jgi:hypothetical protein